MTYRPIVSPLNVGRLRLPEQLWKVTTLFFTGDFVINIDSLNMRFNNIPIENVDINHRNKLLKEVNKMIEIEECDTISLIIRNTYPLKYGKCSFAENIVQILGNLML